MSGAEIRRATPFHKILIANRGEIALRVMRTARAMGYRTVAVYSDADRNARHVREADEAVPIGGALPAQSYLNIKAIIAAARLSGADAVHPGYGFLAENAAFAASCRDAGLVFIGPSPEAMTAMGNKAEAKRLMLEAGVPCVPGYQGESQDEAVLEAEARRIGFPVMIKATAGGGGRGMRLVHEAADFLDALRSACSEARSAFGSAEVILERAIIEPRHIEIQIFGDRYGNVIHLGERDCSVQRRHQKVIEEAPSPAVSAALRAAMGATAVAAARAISYEGAGTLEFLLDAEGHFYFMEMNTRLQVEHPVTEAITGLDLVALQLRVASGEKLPLRQEDVTFTGHAIEVRLCAEDAAQNFMPQSGQMKLWHAPDSIRADHALESGSEISPYYDSMIGKLISHGATRDEARRKLGSALTDLVALGVKTNQTFTRSCLLHPVFVAGDATTAFIAHYGDELRDADSAAQWRILALATILLYETASSSAPSGLAPRQPIDMRLGVNGKAYAVALVNLGDGAYSVATEDHQVTMRIEARAAESIRISCNGLVEKLVFLRKDATLWLHDRGVPYEIQDLTYVAVARKSNHGDGKIRAAINGRVVAVKAGVGDHVQEGEPILTLEAMKMELVHVAPCSGTLTALNIDLHDQVVASRVLAEVTPDAGATP